jgi:RNA polymerase sigma factor (sigma-70 family)
LAGRAAKRQGAGPDRAADARVTELVARHERSLMRVAQHWSLCRDDALDAYQRALEIYLRRLDSLDPATEIAWLKVVVKHEALAVRRQRAELLPVEQVDAEPQATEAQRPVDDVLAARERVRRSAEALRRIKADEAKALVLKGQGLSYREIGESLGWTYTKVNRALTEGRARFLRVYSEIEAGEECERFAPTLAALVGGTASAEALLELRPHIRNCPSCRATVRDLHATRLGRLAALWPLPALVGPLRWVAGVKQHAAGAYYRAVDFTPLAGARPGAAAAAIAGCIAIGSGTTYCVTQGVDPIGGLAHVVAPAREREQAYPRKKRRTQAARASASSVSTPAPTPVATPTAAPPTPSPAPSPKPAIQATPEPTPEPTPPPIPQEEYEPVAPAVAAAAAPAPPAPARTPAPAPAGGPGEFDGP